MHAVAVCGEHLPDPTRSIAWFEMPPTGSISPVLDAPSSPAVSLALRMLLMVLLTVAAAVLAVMAASAFVLPTAVTVAGVVTELLK